MIHINPKHIPFALSLFPFLGVGICLPATVQDWSRGRLNHGDAIFTLIREKNLSPAKLAGLVKMAVRDNYNSELFLKDAEEM